MGQEGSQSSLRHERRIFPVAELRNLLLLWGRPRLLVDALNLDRYHG